MDEGISPLKLLERSAKLTNPDWFTKVDGIGPASLLILNQNLLITIKFNKGECTVHLNAPRPSLEKMGSIYMNGIMKEQNETENHTT